MRIQPIALSASLYANGAQVQRPRPAGTAAASADSVTISQAARDLQAAESEKGGKRNLIDMLSELAHEDPAQAEKLAYERSHGQMAAWLDFSEYVNGTGPLRYAATGEPVTEESEDYFNRISAAEQQGRIDLYNAEKARGTADADILDKIFEYIDTLPTRYKDMINWSGKAVS